MSQATSFMVLLGSVIIVSSCNEQLKVTGIYESAKPSKLELIIYRMQGYAGYTGGEKLHLKGDSTFTLATCGHIATGSWSMQDAHISLRTTAVQRRLDSLRITSANPDTIPMFADEIIYKVKRNTLTNVYASRLTKLVFTGD